MTAQLLQNEIVSCIWSGGLKRHIAEINYSFTEEELLGIAFHFAPTFEERLRLLRLLANHALSVSAHAVRCIDWQRKCLEWFCQLGEHEVYELRIKDEPDAYEERYLCASYDTALQMIDEFYKEYDFAPKTKLSRYTIAKRKVLQIGHSFCEDGLGECVLAAGKVLISVDGPAGERENGKCCGSCADCLNPCVVDLEVRFPPFVSHRSAVKYCLPDGSIHYGIYFNDHGSELMESCYIIPLDGEMLKNRSYEKDWGYHWHEHIPGPYVEEISIAELDTELQESYHAFVAWLDSKAIP